MPQRCEITDSGVSESNPDLVPVGYIEQTCNHITAKLSQSIMLKQCGPNCQERHQHEDRWEQSTSTAHPEVDQRDAVVTFSFGDQQQRDQVARNHEEHLNAKKTTRKPRAVCVVDHHRNNS